MRLFGALAVAVAVLLACWEGRAAAQEKDTLVVMDLRAVKVDKETVFLLTERLRAQIQALGLYKLVSREEMDNILKEHQFQKSDLCDSTKCFVEIGGALGAKKMVAGTVGMVGSTYMVTLKLIDIGQAVEEGSASRTCKGEVDMLLDVIDEMTGALFKVSPVQYLKPPAGAGELKQPQWELAAGPKGNKGWLRLSTFGAGYEGRLIEDVVTWNVEAGAYSGIYENGFGWAFTAKGRFKYYIVPGFFFLTGGVNLGYRLFEKDTYDNHYNSTDGDELLNFFIPGLEAGIGVDFWKLSFEVCATRTLVPTYMVGDEGEMNGTDEYIFYVVPNLTLRLPR